MHVNSTEAVALHTAVPAISQTSQNLCKRASVGRDKLCALGGTAPLAADDNTRVPPIPEDLLAAEWCGDARLHLWWQCDLHLILQAAQAEWAQQVVRG
jgi:hypothetical protein